MAYLSERTHFYEREAVETFWEAWSRAFGTHRIGTAGRRAGDGRGDQGGGWGRARRNESVRLVLDELARTGGHRRGLGTHMANTYGGSARSWQRAIKEARDLYERDRGHTEAVLKRAP
ncbi:hypothetical protein RKD37_002723 [Streptomyces ambofaciens]